MEGPVGRYARASEDYTGISNVAHVLGACVANTISASELVSRNLAGHLRALCDRCCLGQAVPSRLRAIPVSHSLLFAVGAWPPHDGVRRARRLNQSRALWGIAAI